MARKSMMLFVAAALLGPSALAAAADWPTYQHDNQRSGVTSEGINTPLAEEWVFTPTHPPSKAWGDPAPKPMPAQQELPRLRFDDAFHTVSADGLVVFGSSADNKVYALEAASGRVRWEFCTDGPIRFAPTLWKGKVLAGSDDGKVYCLRAVDGRLEWAFSAAPAPDKLLGNGRMISVWPVRTGVIVEDGVAYFGAGVFPAETVLLHAVDARTGKHIWRNDAYGFGGRGEVVPQGYLLSEDDKLFMPCGRSKPAAFDRKTGNFLYQKKLNWRSEGLFGGTYCVAAKPFLFNGHEQIVALNQNNGQLGFTEAARKLTIDGDVVYLLTGEDAVALPRQKWIQARRAKPRLCGEILLMKGDLHHVRSIAGEYPKVKERIPQQEKRLAAAVDELRQATPAAKWRAACKLADSVILTSNLLVAGGDGEVAAFDRSNGNRVWSATVDGKARGLAVADGRLLVSTDKGSIHCFKPGADAKGANIAPAVKAEPYADGKAAGYYATTAEAAIAAAGVRRGYALQLGMLDGAGADNAGRLALELARRTDLVIHVVEPDPGKVAAARKALSEAGVYGPRVVVEQGGLDRLPYSDYFANLILVADSFFAGHTPTPPEEVLRMLKPCGGVAIVGQSQAAMLHAASSATVKAWTIKAWTDRLATTLESAGEKETTKVETRGGWTVITRGPLPGAGRWTHQYGDPGNTACSDDTAVRGPLGILWFGEPGPERMPERHRSNVAPLALEGRMFVQGEDIVMAYDAYNGVELWSREIPGATRLNMKTGVSNLAADDKSIFVVVGEECLRLDAATGRTLRTYRPPDVADQKWRDWAYVACADGLLYGSRSNVLFALDVATGQVKWTYKAKQPQRLTICIGDGRLFYVDKSVTPEQTAEALKNVTPETRVDRTGKPIPPDVRLLIALDARTGDVLWQKPKYVSDCVVSVSRGAGEMTVMYARGVLMLCGQPWNGHFWKEFLSGQFSRRSLIALSAEDGGEIWSERQGYRSRPLIVGDVIYAEPWARELKTGQQVLRAHPITGEQTRWQMSRPGHHCGNIAASPNMLFFRSGSSGYYDLLADYGTAHMGAQRPGCWINCVAANGVVMMPEASSGCVCPYAYQCTLVLKPRETNRLWCLYSAAGKINPVKRLAVNFGAAGDRLDAAGGLWLAYPRPRTDRLVMDLPLEVSKQGDFLRDGANFLAIDGTDDPWLFASACEGMSECRLPLLANVLDDPAVYTVRLYFAETKATRPGQRVFDIALQGRTVAKGFDVFARAGGANKAVVAEFKGVVVTDSLRVGLAPVKGKTILHGVEVVRE